MSVRFVNIGFNNVVQAEKIVSVVSPDSSPMRKLKDAAKEARHLVDATQGRKTRSVLVTDSNHVILSAITVESIIQRIENQNRIQWDKKKSPDEGT